MVDRNQEQLNQEQPYFSRASRIKFFDIVIKSGQGAILKDANDKEYIDFLASASANNVGSSHPHVVEAIQKQAAQLVQYIPSYFANEPEIKLVQRLAKLAPMSGPVEIAWGNSGSDANDAVIKFARAYTKRPYIVSFMGAYHGSTFGSLSMSAVNLNMTRKMGPLLPGIVKVPFPSPWLRNDGETDDQFSDRMFEAFKMPFESYLPADETALINIEAIQGDGGFVKAPQRYLEKVSRFAKDHGIVFAVDEVNQGMGRTGKMWSIQNFPRIEPDIIAVGKSLASGLPLSAVIGRSDIMESLDAPGNTYTTAGNPLTTAAANATLDVIEQEHLMERSTELGRLAQNYFEQLSELFEFVGNVRLYGLNGGIDIIDPNNGQPDAKAATQIITRLCEKGVLMITVHGNVLRFQPPLVITKAQLERGLQIIGEVMQELADGKLKAPTESIGW